MNSFRLFLSGLALLLASCTTGTIAQLKDVKVDLKDEKVDGGLDKAIQSYQLYLDQTPRSDKEPESDMTPESIRRLADLKLKKKYDVLESGAAGEKVALPVRDNIDHPAAFGTTKQPVPASDDAGKEKPLTAGDRGKEDIKDFEMRTTAGGQIKSAPATKAMPDGAGTDQQPAGTQEAITLYNKLLDDYPGYELNDEVLYQLARTYDELGNVEEVMKMMNRLVKDYPHSRYIEEVQFRRGEYYYARKKFSDAKDAYKAIVDIGVGSSYYEFALYKLGWTYYKLELYEKAIHQFVTLLDQKVATGYDLDHPKDSFDEKRIDDTYRVMSLNFSNLGGADAVAAYFNKYGKRAYEASVYIDLGDYYLDKRRYSDAAATFKAFDKSNPFHKLSPYFDMWAIDSYKAGGFTGPVIESKQEFVANYGLKSAYWTRFDIAAFHEISGYVKTSLKELANYYHAQYQDVRFVTNKDENFQEALKWYREFLSSFPKDESAPAIHYQLADLLHENKWYGQAAVEYEHIAYDYPAHEKSAAAGYAAVYAYRESLAIAAQDEGERVKRDVIRSSLKFAETFPKNEKAALVTSAAVDDIYGMKEYASAAVTARKLLAGYPGAEQPIRRAAWLIYAHSSFELGNFKEAEEGYLSALRLTAENDTSRAGLIENFAASFYKQGEQANKLGDYKTAAIYFYFVGTFAPTAKIRPVADFEGATALMQLKDWDAVVNAVRTFRANYPGHALQPELTKKIAFAYREAGNLSLAAAEYERLETQSQDVAGRRAALELAAELYIQAKEMDKAYTVYRRYVSNFPHPAEDALEMRNKIATYLKTRDDMEGYLSELKRIMEADARAGSERTDRTRYLGTEAALAFAELTIKQFAEIKLVEPYAENLLKKQNAMKVAKERLEKLFDYETDVVTSAATYYFAEMYYDFSRALVESERPVDLDALEKEQYELAIEEQAYLFEEKTIQVHQKNLELMTRGIYNSWIEMSIERLAKMVPARYARFEESSGYIKAVENVSYATLIDPKRVIPEPSSVTVAIPPASGFVPVREMSPAQKEEIESDFLAAMGSIKSAEYDKAIKLFNKVIAQSPDNPVPYINLALVYEKMQNLMLAEENLKLAIKLDPENPVASNEYALLYRKSGRFTEARRIYEKILGKYPDFIMAHKNLGILCDLYMKDYKCALKEYVIYSGLMPDDGNVKVWIADMQKRS